MARKIYSELEAEAALCLWEAMLEAKFTNEKREEEGLEERSDMVSVWDDTGSLFMRHEALRLAHVVCETYELIPVGARDAIAYDWEIVPAILDTFRWSHQGAAHDAPAQIAAVVTVALEAEQKRFQDSQRKAA